MTHAILQVGGGLAESAGQAATVVATLLLALMLLALGGFAYKSLRGDGIEWPDDREAEDDDGDVSRGTDDDEWDYY